MQEKRTLRWTLSQGEYLTRKKSPVYGIGHIASHELRQRVRCAAVLEPKGITPRAQHFVICYGCVHYCWTPACFYEVARMCRIRPLFWSLALNPPSPKDSILYHEWLEVREQLKLKL